MKSALIILARFPSLVCAAWHIAGCATVPAHVDSAPPSLSSPSPASPSPPNVAACDVARPRFEACELAAGMLRVALEDGDVAARREISTWVQNKSREWASALRSGIAGDAALELEAAAQADELERLPDISRSSLFIDPLARLAASSERVRARCPDPPPQVVVPPDGRLPPVAVQTIIRAHFPALRHCYERGLGADSKLAGKISTKFVIERDGFVAKVDDAGSTLRSGDVIACVHGVYRALRFPAPRRGTVTVVYPIDFAPGD